MDSVIKDSIQKIEKGIVPEGYKKTKVGIIPEDWEVKKLDEVSIDGGTYGINAAAVQYKDELPKYLRITDISDDGRYLDDDKKSVNNKNYKKFILNDDDIVFARTGNTTGKTYLYNKDDGELVYAGFLIKFSIDPQIANSKYIYENTKTNLYRIWVKVMSARSGQPGINSKEYESLRFALPPLQEQEKIAEILSTWDNAIENIEKLIKEKEKQKKGLMQELLTGKTRLPGFTGEWEEVKLGDIGELRTSSVNKKTSEDEKRVLLLNYMDVYNNKYINSHINFMEVTATDHQIETNNLVKGDILFTPSSETRDDIGHSAVVIEDMEDVLYSYHLMRFRIYSESLLDIGFRGYCFNNEKILREFSKLATGSTRYTLSKADFENIEFKYPPLAEQKAIAEILSTADKEIELLNKLLANKKEEKKGLMQLLLTGIVRV